MKILKFLWIGILIMSSCKKDPNVIVPEQEYYYWADSKKVFLTIKEDVFIAVVNEDEITNTTKALKEKKVTIDHKEKSYYILSSPNAQVSQELRKGQGVFNKLNLCPTFNTSNGIIIPTDQITVKPKAGVKIEAILEFLGNEVVSHTTTSYGTTLIKIKYIKNVFSLSNKIYEKGLAEYSHPDFYLPLDLF
ncbi:hypothetical protein ACR79B_00115 [Sphingobacterium spiritivorum]|uniref:hypothetical protein n=1 Tax=Sphingobacterium spiritivorum TaxID=258 RepID=UPI003DA3B3A6